MKSRESVVALLIALLGVTLITILLFLNKIGETTFAILLPIICLFGLALYGFRRLREIDFKNLKLTLDSIEKAKRDVYAKEKDLKNIALQLAKILAFNSAFQGRWGSEESNKLLKRWYRNKTEQILAMLSLPNKDRSSITAILDAFDRFDNLEKKEEKEKEFQAIMDYIKVDLDN